MLCSATAALSGWCSSLKHSAKSMNDIYVCIKRTSRILSIRLQYANNQ
jgi:hypothetical protein